MKRPLIAIILIVAVIILGGGYYWHTHVQTMSKPVATDQSQIQIPLALAVPAPKGTLTPTFPKDLIVVPNAIIAQSGIYMTKATPGVATTTVLMTVYGTASSTNDVLRAYDDYAAANAYPILNSEVRSDGVTRFVRFMRGTSTISVTIAVPNKNSLTVVTVVEERGK